MGASQRFAGTLPSGQSTYAIASGGTVGNVLAGTMFEFVGARFRAIRIWAVQDTVANADVVIGVTYGTVTAVEEGFSIPKVIAADNGSGPLRNEHEICSFLAAPNDRIKVSLRNQGSATTGAGLGARIFIEHQDM